MITGLDHVVVLVGDIAAAEAAYQTLFARQPSWRNNGDGADRVLFTLDNMTLELMAPSGEARPRTGSAPCWRRKARGWPVFASAPAISPKCTAGSIG
jgi:hypothetical protein